MNKFNEVYSRIIMEMNGEVPIENTEIEEISVTMPSPWNIKPDNTRPYEHLTDENMQEIKEKWKREYNVTAEYNGPEPHNSTWTISGPKENVKIILGAQWDPYETETLRPTDAAKLMSKEDFIKVYGVETAKKYF